MTFWFEDRIVVVDGSFFLWPASSSPSQSTSPSTSWWWGWKVTRPPMRREPSGSMGPRPQGSRSGLPSRNRSPPTSWGTSWPPTSLSSLKSAPLNLDLLGNMLCFKRLQLTMFSTVCSDYKCVDLWLPSTNVIFILY